jgi:ubiquinone/menaquinone biosynthesis C-methylase UbiE
MDRAETIRGGAADADRLARMSTVMASSTLRFLQTAGVRPGASCLDVGCRDGQVAIEMARAVGPAGRVVGVDEDDEALGIARRAAQDAGVEVRFVHGELVRDLGETDVDLAFARLVLSHRVDPMAVLRAMCAAVTPGGTVVVEDIFTPTLRAEPALPALDELIDVYCTTERHHGGDPTIGPRLPAHLRAAGLVDVHEETVVNRMTTPDQKLFLAELVDNMQDAVLGAEAATPEQLSELRSAIAAGAQRADTIFFQARVHQVSGRRPT